MEKKVSSTDFIVDSEYEKRMKESFYDNFYLDVSDGLMKWREFTAREKSKSILELSRGLKFKKVVEVECGLCNTIARLEKSDFAPEFYGVEVSPSVFYYNKRKTRIGKLKAVYLLDTMETKFEDSSFDLGILSHVLEHVSAPEKLLAETLRISKYVIIEVPLENCVSVNLYAKFLERQTGKKRTDNPTGHLNFFDKASIWSLVKKSSGEIMGERTYFSWRVFSVSFGLKNILEYYKSILFYLIYKVTNSKIVCCNYAVLVRKRTP
jgi:ubiquinone/menaquinone biosynthesis C-methylase UbiE